MRRHYSDQEKAEALAALAANKGNVKLTARTLGIPRMTLAHWANGDCSPEVTKLGHLKKGELASTLEALAHKHVDACPDKIADANLQATATSLGICVDKMLLLRGEPTEIKGQMTDQEAHEEILRLGTELGYFEPKPN
jgi:hypothetical protein